MSAGPIRRLHHHGDRDQRSSVALRSRNHWRSSCLSCHRLDGCRVCSRGHARVGRVGLRVSRTQPASRVCVGACGKAGLAELRAYSLGVSLAAQCSRRASARPRLAALEKGWGWYPVRMVLAMRPNFLALGGDFWRATAQKATELENEEIFDELLDHFPQDHKARRSEQLRNSPRWFSYGAYRQRFKQVGTAYGNSSHTRTTLYVGPYEKATNPTSTGRRYRPRTRSDAEPRPYSERGRERNLDRRDAGRQYGCRDSLLRLCKQRQRCAGPCKRPSRHCAVRRLGMSDKEKDARQLRKMQAQVALYRAQQVQLKA